MISRYRALFKVCPTITEIRFGLVFLFQSDYLTFVGPKVTKALYFTDAASQQHSEIGDIHVATHDFKFGDNT